MECDYGTVCDFPNAQISLNLPAGVTYTSDSGLFLIANSSALMSVLPSGVQNYYNRVLDAYNATSSGSSVTWLLK